MPRLTGSAIRSGVGAPRGLRTLVVLVCVSLMTVTLYLCEGPTGPVHTLRNAVRTVEAPFDWLGSQIVRPFETFGQMVVDASADEESLTELRDRNAALTAQLAELGEYRLENERLRSMLELSSAYGLRGIAARVVGTSSDDWSRTVTIDKGSASGVNLDMAVTDGKGVVGQVTAVTSSSATVTLLSDPGYQCSALLQDSRATGVLQGSVDGSLHLEYVPVTQGVRVGELVVTSGMGGAYPKGLLIGTVASVTNAPSDVYHTIVVTPVARVANYEEVCVVLSSDAQQAQVATELLLTTGSPLPADQAAPDAVDGEEGGEAVW